MNRKLRMDELGRLSEEEFEKASKLPVVVVLDNVRSLHNVGSIFRSCDAFGVDHLYLCGITATPPHREIQKTALGATETVCWTKFDNTLEAINDLRGQGYEVLVMEQTEQTVRLDDFVPEIGRKYAIVFGHEVKGVEQEVIDKADMSLEIPQFGTKHSLNVSVAMGVTLWEIVRKLSA